MTILKVKNISYSLLAIFTLNVLLTSCEKEESHTETLAEVINYSNSVESATNNNEIILNEFQNISYSKSEVYVYGANFESTIKNPIVELTGDLEINKVGVVTGNVKVINNNKSIDGLVSIENGYIYYKRDKQTVKMDINNIENLLILKNGNKKESIVNGFHIMDDLIKNQSSKTANLSLEAQAVCSFLAIFNSPEWMANSNFANESSLISLRDCSFWQRAALWGVGGTIAAFAFGGCTAYSAACGVTIFIYFGATLVPCWLTGGACYAAAWGGTQAAYETLVNYYCN